MLTYLMFQAQYSKTGFDYLSATDYESLNAFSSRDDQAVQVSFDVTGAIQVGDVTIVYVS